MNISTKLIFLLTLTVGAVMLLASFLSLRQREAALDAALRDELRAHAVTLQIALEENYAAGRASEAQRLIDRLRENSRVYAVFLFDERGELLALSQSAAAEEFRQPPELAEVLRAGAPVETVREIGGRRFLSLILPLRFGALEIVKPLALIENDIARARVNWLTTTLFLLAVIFLVVTVVLRRSLSRPLRELLGGAGALGRGESDYRVPLAGRRDELELLATEFNRMADGLEAQRRAARAEAENRLALERELRHSERLASVGRLAAGIAHELGAPLNVIDARAEQLLSKPDAAPEKREKNLSIIRAQVKRISHVVRQLLNLARPYDLRLTAIQIGALVAESLEEIRPVAERAGVRIDFSADGEYQINADRDFLRQVWANVFQNALHAINGAGGDLSASVTAEELEGRRFAAVRVADTGGGIAPEHLDKIFDPFYTTKDIGEGTGLGLAVARRIVEEHGGRIAAENAARGALFTVYLPLYNQEDEK